MVFDLVPWSLTHFLAWRHGRSARQGRAGVECSPCYESACHQNDFEAVILRSNSYVMLLKITRIQVVFASNIALFWDNPKRASKCRIYGVIYRLQSRMSKLCAWHLELPYHGPDADTVCIITCLLCSWYKCHKEHWNILEKVRTVLKETAVAKDNWLYLTPVLFGPVKVRNEAEMQQSGGKSTFFCYTLHEAYQTPSSISDQHQSNTRHPVAQQSATEQIPALWRHLARGNQSFFLMNVLLICSRLHKQIYALFK